MNIEEVRAAWKEAQEESSAEGARNSFEEAFFHRTGLSKGEVEHAFTAWNRLPRDRVEEIAESHGVTVQEGGFQAYLVTRYWPTDPELQIIQKLARYIGNTPDAQERLENILENILECHARVGRFPIDYVLYDGWPEGHGDPREGKPWPPEEDCSSCGTGRKGSPERHRFGCAIYGARGMVIPVIQAEDGTLHAQLPGAKDEQ